MGDFISFFPLLVSLGVASIRFPGLVLFLIFFPQLISDYAKILTEDEEMRSWLLQGVERCRRQFPNMKKKTLNASEN